MHRVSTPKYTRLTHRRGVSTPVRAAAQSKEDTGRLDYVLIDFTDFIEDKVRRDGTLTHLDKFKNYNCIGY